MLGADTSNESVYKRGVTHSQLYDIRGSQLSSFWFEQAGHVLDA
jgi:hypothetical protein